MQTFNNYSELATPISETGLNFIRSCFNATPTWIKVQLRADNGYLTVKLRYWYNDNTTITLSLPIDRDLFFAIVDTMRGKVSKLNNYVAKNHRVGIINKPEIEDTYLSIMLRLTQLYKIEIGKRFISKNGNVYEHVLFRPNANTVIEMFVPASQGVRIAINKLLLSAKLKKGESNFLHGRGWAYFLYMTSPLSSFQYLWVVILQLRQA